MANDIRRYDNLLPGLNTADLKKMANLWGGNSKMAKDDCIQYLSQALTDPQKIDAALARMQPFERAALGLLKLFGGKQDLHALGDAVKATGVVHSDTHKSKAYRPASTTGALIERGIVLTVSGERFYDYGYSYTTVPVFADDRVLARVGEFERVPLKLEAAAPPTVSTARRAQNLVLDVIAMVRAINDIGGIGLTKAGELRVNDARKFGRKMGWGDRIEYDGLPFSDPARVYAGALAASRLLTLDGDRLVGAVGLEQIGARPAAELMRILAGGILGLSEWLEYDAGPQDYWMKHHVGRGRFIVLAALCCLPSPGAWLRFDDFERALFDRVGHYFSIGSVKSEPQWTKSPAEQQAALAIWRLSLRQNWEKIDVRWLHDVFRTWLYAFGLVEVSLAGDRVELFRLTDAGRVALLYEAPPATAQPAAEQKTAWIVQPNFDVVVYLDGAATEQIAFLERFAERTSLAQHMAQYRLTRTSVYAGLEHGLDAERLLAGLAAGSRIELPGNVVAEIRTWAMLRERIVVRKHADLLEFPDAAERQSALDGGMAGTAVGERFLLIKGDPVKNGVNQLAPQVIDYAGQTTPKCLIVTADGEITLTASRDLYTPGYLDLWAERKSDATWQLTHKTVAEAIRRGRTLRELMALLQDRLTKPLPALLKVALRSWAGEAIVAGVGEAVILRCADPEALVALLASPLLKPHLLERIGTDAVLVKSESISQVRAVLDWAGLQTSAQIVKQRF